MVVLVAVLVWAGCGGERGTAARATSVAGGVRTEPRASEGSRAARGVRAPEPPLPDAPESAEQEGARDADADAAPAPPGELPEEEVGTGDCVLTLRLVDATTGALVASRVRIWRIGVAASESWTAGDHVQRSLDVPLDGAVVRGLPEGRYRVEVDAERNSADDPAEFMLTDETATTVLVAMPRALPVRCVVVDGSGSPHSSALHRAGSSGWGPATRARPAPAWASPRGRSGANASAAGGVATRGVWSGASSFRAVDAGPAGFDLGTIPEATRVASFDQIHELRFDGASAVRVRADSQGAARGGYLAVAVPVADLVSHVRLPDGRNALEAGAGVRAMCDAIPCPPGAPRGLWREVPIRVSVTLEGLAPLDVEWRASDPPRATVELVRQAPVRAGTGGAPVGR